MGSSIMSAFLVLLTAAASLALPQYPLPFNSLPHFLPNIPQQFAGFQFPQQVLPPWFNPGQMFLDEAFIPAWLKPQEENEEANNDVVENDEASDNAVSADDNADSADDNGDSADDNGDSVDDNADVAESADVVETARFMDNTEPATTDDESATAVKKANEEYLKHRPSRPSTGYVTTGGYSGAYNRPTGYTGYSVYPSGYPSYTSGSSGSLTYPSSGSSGSLAYPSSGSSGYSGSLTYPSSGYNGGYSYPTGYTGGSTYTSGTSYPGFSGSSGFGGNTGYFTNTNGGYYGY